MTIAAGEFKTHCLGILTRMQDEPEEVLLTKHGRVIAKVVPASGDDTRGWEKLRGTAHFTEDALFSDDGVREDLS